MNASRLVAGWISWLIVATVLYAFAWSVWDDQLRYAIPKNLGLWLCGRLGVTSLEGTYDVFIWTTSLLAVLIVHAIVLAGLRSVRTRCVHLQERRSKWPSWLFAAVGWISWLLVLTFALLFIGDEIHQARGGKISSEPLAQWVELIGVFVVVGSLHLAFLKIARRPC
jgi:hypothetical protein